MSTLHNKRRRARKADAHPDHPHWRAPSALLMALEARALLEWASLPVAWRWLTRSVPAGDGHPVLVLPGLVASDASTWPLRRFLKRAGYVPYGWKLGANLGPRDGIVHGLTLRVRAIEQLHGRSVSLIGWSLGGAMARALAVAMPERIRSVITLGSPLGGHPKATNAWRIFEWVSGFKADDPRLLAQMKRHAPVPTTSILSRSDGVVNWRMSMVPEHATSETIAINASHMGLGVHPAALWAIADRLAQPEGYWLPFDRNGWHALFYSDPRREHRAARLARTATA